MNQWKSGEWADVPSAQPRIPEPANTKLSVVLPFIEKEIGDIADLLNLCIPLSGRIERNLFLLPFKGVNCDAIKEIAKRAFGSIAVIRDAEGIFSDWQGREKMRSASGPNSLFRQAAWFFYLNRRFGSWLWLEPDCQPVTSRWMYDLEREHFEVGKPFTGVKMQLGDGKEYMNGVGIYPWNAIQYAPGLVQSTMWKQHPEIEVGFDVAGGDEVLRNAHITKLIQLTSHLSKEDVRVRPETVLCHGQINSSGSDGTHVPAPSTVQPATQQGEPESARNTFLGEYGVARDAQTETLGETQPRHVHSHEKGIDPRSLAQEPKFEDGASFSDQIRFHINRLQELQNGQLYRHNRIVSELRKAKLIPRARKK